MPEVGSSAPTFTLLDQDKKPVSLADFKGQRSVVLAFFPAAFTGTCTKELCTFRDSMSAFNQVSASVLGISVDAPFSNAAFARQNGLEFPVLSDHQREATRAYGVALENFAGMTGYTASQRAVFVVDKGGVIRYAWVAPNPGVEPDYEAVKNAVSTLA